MTEVVLKKALHKINKWLFIRQPKRYKHLLRCIDKYKCRRIMEVGTWNGNHAAEMIEAAKKHWAPEEIEYYGFDLFEGLDEETMKKEISKKPCSMKEVKEKLEKTGAKIALYKGNTLITLPEKIKNLPRMDFIFIDGGHSIETIQNDWECSRQLMHDQTAVIFDDYWNMESAGCRKIIEAIDCDEFFVTILEPADEFEKDWGILRINFVQVTRRSETRDKL